jgi:hypothetical protein
VNQPNKEAEASAEVGEGRAQTQHAADTERDVGLCALVGRFHQICGRTHYTVPQFGCGTECSAFYIVDSITGRVYGGFGIADLPGKWLEKQSSDQPLRIQFVPSSRLLKINGCPNEQDCGYYDYVMVDGKGLKLVQKWLLPKEFQD